jgi:hypothetical protein
MNELENGEWCEAVMESVEKDRRKRWREWENDEW